MDTSSEEQGYGEVQEEVEDIGPAEFYHVSLVQGATGKYKIFMTYEHEGEVYECWTDTSHNTLSLAQSEKDMILREGIEDPEHGEIPLENIVSVEIRQRVELEDDTDNE